MLQRLEKSQGVDIKTSPAYGRLREALSQSAQEATFNDLASKFVSSAFDSFQMPLGVDELRRIAHEMVISQEEAIQSAIIGRRGQERDIKILSRALQEEIRKVYQVKVQEDLGGYLRKFTDYIFAGKSSENREKFIADGMIKLLDDLALLGIREEVLKLLEGDVEKRQEVAILNRAFAKRISALVDGFPDLEIGVSLLKKSMENPQSGVSENTLLQTWIENLYRILKYPYDKSYRNRSFAKDDIGVTFAGIVNQIERKRQQEEEQGGDEPEAQSWIKKVLPDDCIERKKHLIEAITMEPPDPARIIRPTHQAPMEVRKNGDGNGHASNNGQDKKKGPGAKREARLKRQRRKYS